MKKVTIIKHADILYGKDLEFIENTTLYIDENGTITKILNNKNNLLVPYTGDAVESDEYYDIIDAHGFILIPGLINSHTHIGDSIGKDLSSSSNLDVRVHPNHSIKKTILEKTKKDHLKQIIRNSAISMLQKGITTFIDFREDGVEGIAILNDSLKDIPIKKLVLGRIITYPKYSSNISNNNDEEKKNNIQNYDNDSDKDEFSDDEYNKNSYNTANSNDDKYSSSVINIEKIDENSFINDGKNILEICDGFGLSGANEYSDSILTLYDKISKEFADDMNNKRKKPIKAIHAAESPNTVQLSLKNTNKTEIERTIHTLKPDIYVHITNPTENDLDLLQKTGKGIVICPRANGILGTGFIPLKKMLNLGLRIAIGTDNVMLNSPDIFRELDFLIKSQRALEKDVAFLEPREILKMVTTNIHEIFGINVGCIDVGYQADLLFINKYDIDIYPLHDPHMSIAHRCSERQIGQIMIDGKLILEKTKLN